MKIYLSNTGRGGELAILTSIVHAYRTAYPDSYIKVVTSHNGLYHTIWENSMDINDWEPLVFRTPMPNGRAFKDPLLAEKEQADQAKKQGYDHIEITAEYDLSPAINKAVIPKPIIENLYRRLKHKPCKLEGIERKVFMWPTDEEHAAAESLISTYGKDLVLISYMANSASPMFDHDSYQQLADEISKTHPVAFTGNNRHKPLDKHIDLRGTTFSFLYALSLRLNYYIGPDTATSWIVTRMPGLLITIRGDSLYPIDNTGLIANGYREPINTLELNLAAGSPVHSGRKGRPAAQSAIEKVVSDLRAHQVQP